MKGLGALGRRARVGALLMAGLGAALVGATWSLSEAQEGAPKASRLAEVLGIDLGQEVDVSPALKAQAKAVGQDAVCLCGTCPRRTIASCECGWAATHKKTIELALLKGLTGPDILAGYQKAYGLKAFPEPPNEGFGRASYLLPYAAAVVGLILVFVVGFRARRRATRVSESASDAPLPEDSEREEAKNILRQELEDLD